MGSPVKKRAKADGGGPPAKKAKKGAGPSQTRDKEVLDKRKPAPLPRVSALKVLLKKKMNEGQGDGPDEGMGLGDLVDDGNNMKRIKRDMKDDDELNEEEQDIVKKRMKMMQQRMLEFERREKIRKYGEVRNVAGPMVTEEEIDEALEMSKGNESEAALKLCDRKTLAQIRQTLARECTYEQRQQERQRSGQLLAGQKVKTKRINVKALSISFHTDGKKYERKKLKLDDAIASGPSEDWSPARIRAWESIETNTNAYYYRFNAPGEPQKNGGWSKEEAALFMEIYNKLGGAKPNMKWGYFSMYIPGRVGYQCSNYYRTLIEKGQVHDPYYIIDEKGKSHFVFGRGKANAKVVEQMQNNGGFMADVVASAKVASRETSANATRVTTKREPKPRKPVKKVSKKRKGKGDDNIYADEVTDDDEDFDETAYNYKKKYVSSFRSGRRNRGEEVQENPLPGFLCPITYEEVEAPAISPYGYVAGYQQWANCLPSGRCPFTKQPLKLDQIVLLTKDNIEQYRDKIVNG